MFTRTLPILLFLLFHVTLVAAQDLVTPVETGDLTPAQEAAIIRLQNLATTDTLQVVQIDVDLLQGDADFFISLPEDAVVGLARTSEVADVSADVMNWTGETPVGYALEGADEAQAAMAVEGSEVSGTVWTTRGVYSIQPLPGGLHAIIKFDAADFPEEHPPLDGETMDIPEPDVSELRPEGDASVADVRVLVAITPAALELVGNPLTFAGQAVNSANLSYSNSGVNMKLTLAGVATVDYVESGDHRTDVARLASRNDGHMDDIQALRIETQADLVVLINDDDSYCGMARQIYAGASSAFASVHATCAVANLSFAHEIGHLLGACHDPSASSGCSPFAYGHGFQNPGDGVRTVMAYPCAGASCIRMPQWSRPPGWGNEQKSYDARVLNETSIRAAAFLP